MNSTTNHSLVSNAKEDSDGKNRGPDLDLVTATFAGVFVLLVVLAFASNLTTYSYGDDYLPAGEYLLHIKDQTGKPIEGAILNVYVGDTQVPVYDYPLEAYASKGGLTSNVEGIIVIDNPPKGMEMDSEGWALFWIFPIIDGNTNFTCEIKASGYEPLKFPLDRLIDVVVTNPFNTHTTKVTVNNEDLILRIYELDLSLQEQ